MMYADNLTLVANSARDLHKMLEKLHTCRLNVLCTPSFVRRCWAGMLRIYCKRQFYPWLVLSLRRTGVLLMPDSEFYRLSTLTLQNYSPVRCSAKRWTAVLMYIVLPNCEIEKQVTTCTAIPISRNAGMQAVRLYIHRLNAPPRLPKPPRQGVLICLHVLPVLLYPVTCL